MPWLTEPPKPTTNPDSKAPKKLLFHHIFCKSSKHCPLHQWSREYAVKRDKSLVALCQCLCKRKSCTAKLHIHNHNSTVCTILLCKGRKVVTLWMIHVTVTECTTWSGGKMCKDNFYSSTDVFDSIHTKTMNYCSTVSPSWKRMCWLLHDNDSEIQIRVKDHLTPTVCKDKKTEVSWPIWTASPHRVISVMRMETLWS